MSDFDIKFGPWLNYGKGKIGKEMDELVTESWSPFNGYNIAQVFIYCMSYAFAKGKNPEKPPPGSGSMPASAFDHDMRDFMKALAVAHTKDLDVVTDPKKVVAIGEGYAFAGFQDVYDKIKNRKSDISPESILEDILRKITESDRDQDDEKPASVQDAT